MAMPLWEQTARGLRNRIENGEWPDGTLLPREPDLAAEFGVSRDTVRQALRQLTLEGLLTASRGRGRQVRRYQRLEWWPGRFEARAFRGDVPGSPHDAWGSDVVDQGRTPQQEVEVGVLTAPDRVARLLHISPGDPIVRRARTRLVDGCPWQTGDSYYPMWLVDKGDQILMRPGDITVPGGFMAFLGHEQVKFADQMIGRMPTLEETQRLELGAGTPVIEHVRTGYDADDTPVRVIITIAPGDRHVIRYDVDA